jgi:hypothetical protein
MEAHQRETEESTSKTLEKPLPIWGITIPWWKYTARALAYRSKALHVVCSSLSALLADLRAP